MTAPIRIQEVGHSFGRLKALDGIALDIAAGEYLTLLGPSGCGKTTLLSVLGGFVVPDHGRVLIGGRDVTGLPPAKRPTTTMFQDYALFPHMTVRDNVAFGPRMAGVGRAHRHARAEAQLELVGLRDAAGKRPHQLSGGQRQRVALARALAVEPDVLLLDEPLGALDLGLRRSMQDELKAIQRRVGTTFIHVTHDQEEAMAISDRIVVMNAGRIEDAGTAERLYRQPATLFTAGFLGEMNRLSARRAGQGVETPLGRLPLSAPSGTGALVLCLRPEALRTDPAGAALGRARLEDAAFFGTHVRARLRPEAAPEQTLIAHLPPGAVPTPGAALDLWAEATDLMLFAED